LISGKFSLSTFSTFMEGRWIISSVRESYLKAGVFNLYFELNLETLWGFFLGTLLKCLKSLILYCKYSGVSVSVLGSFPEHPLHEHHPYSVLTYYQYWFTYPYSKVRIAGPQCVIKWSLFNKKIKNGTPVENPCLKELAYLSASSHNNKMYS